MAKATSIRQNEASEFGKHKAEAESNVAAIAKAIAAIDAAMPVLFANKQLACTPYIPANNDCDPI